MVQKIQYSDNLKEGTDKLNQSIDQSNAAILQSNNADQKSTQALNNSVSTQTQLDNIVVEGDSSVEAAQARVDSKGESFPTLKARIDNFEVSATAQLQQIGVDVTQFGGSWDGVGDDTLSVKSAINYAKLNKHTHFILPENVKLSDRLIFNVDDFPNGVTIDLSRTKLIWNNTTIDMNVDMYTRHNGIFSFVGKWISETPISHYETVKSAPTQNFYKKQGCFTVSDAGLFNVGDYVEITIPFTIQTYADYIPAIEIMARVVGVDTANQRVYTDYYSPLNFSGFNYFGSSLKKILPIKNIKIIGGSIEDTSNLVNRDKMGTLTESQRKKAVSFFGFRRAANVTIENVEGTRNKFPAIMVDVGYNFNLTNIEIANPDAIGGGEGYLAQFLRTNKIHANNLIGENVRHVVDFSSSANAYVSNSYGETSIEAAFDCHGMQEHDIVFDNCRGKFVIGNGIVGFPELFGKISILNSVGSLNVNHSDDLFISNSDLQLDLFYTEGNVVFRDSVIRLSGINTIEKRKRNQDKDFATLTFDNVEITTWEHTEDELRIHFIRNFNSVRVSGGLVSFKTNKQLLSFVDNEKVVISDVKRKNTTFYYGATVGKQFDISIKNVTTLYEKNAPILTSDYSAVDNFSALSAGVGRVVYKENSFKYLSDSTSKPVLYLAINGGGTGNVDFYIDDNIVESSFINKIQVITNQSPQSNIYATRNNLINVSENSNVSLEKSAEPLNFNTQFKNVEPSLLNGWKASEGVEVGYQMTKGGIVSLAGSVTGGTSDISGVTLLTLPIDFRPSKSKVFGVLGVSSAGALDNYRIKVNTTGEVMIQGTDVLSVYLDGVSFNTQ